jgi:hypothetical protein
MEEERNGLRKLEQLVNKQEKNKYFISNFILI